MHSPEPLLTAQCALYPALGVQDLVKALYQSEFGCGHLVSDPERGLRWLLSESAECVNDGTPPVESLGAFSRVHLRALQQTSLAPETLFRLFALSAREPAGDMAHFLCRLEAMEVSIDAGELPLCPDEAHAFLADYRAAGCPATHHSEAFRASYSPAYRVMRSDFARFLPLFAAIDRLMAGDSPVTVAIEGGSASGKSTMGRLLADVYGCNVFHMDDFFLQMHQRTPERFAEPGGNVDYDRFREEILIPLRAGKPFSYRPFDCSQMALGEPVEAVPGKLTVIEGAYSTHPALEGGYDLTVFLSLDKEEQAARILARNGAAMQKRFLGEWIPLEEKYFAHFGIREKCDLTLDMTGL